MITVLSFIDWYLPGYKAGGVLKAFSNQVAHLEGKVHFKIITRNVDYQDDTPYDSITANAWNKIAPNADAYYISADQLNYSNLKKIVKACAFDVAYIHGIYSFYFSILPIHLVRLMKPKKIIVAAHGMLGKHSLSVKRGKKVYFLKLAGLLGYYRKVIFHAANEDEKADALELIGPKAQVIVAEELPMKVELAAWQSRPKEVGHLRMCSVARIAPEKNTAYALEILTQCTTGNIEYDIYGPIYSEEYWAKCLQLIDQCPPNVKVSYQGSLPGALVLQKLSEYHLMFMPTTGENFGHTILESFMAATPVLISTNTPWKKLAAQQCGWDIDLKRPAEFVEAVNQIQAMDQLQYDEISKASLQFAKAFTSENSLLTQNVNLFSYE